MAFIEEPERVERPGAAYRERMEDGLTVIVPQVQRNCSDAEAREAQRRVVDELLARDRFAGAAFWYYTPMALPFSDHVETTRVYDCMDELSLFKNAPATLVTNERALLASADVVFTGGRSLYYSKRRMHRNVHCFPSAVDGEHFSARGNHEPADLTALRRPRLGFYGVIDERFDAHYVAQLAQYLPDWELVFLGPVVKISEIDLPRGENVHYLGMKSYAELPAYLEHWDATLLPFALNDSTRYISPTKTLEYLAAGKPVISTPIADVVDPYGKEGIVAIAATAQEAARAVRRSHEVAASAGWRKRAAEIAREASWDSTVERMQILLASAREGAARTVAG